MFRDAWRAQPRRSYDEFIERLRAEQRPRRSIYQRNGTFELALQYGADVDRLSALSAALWKQGVEARWVPPAAFDDLEPLASRRRRARCSSRSHGFVGVTSLTLAAAAAAERARRHVQDRDRRDSDLPMPGDRVGVQTSSVDVGRRSRGARGRQLVVADHRRGRRPGAGEADPRTTDPVAGRAGRDSARVVGTAMATSCRGPMDRCWSDRRSRTSASTRAHTDEAVGKLRAAAGRTRAVPGRRADDRACAPVFARAGRTTCRCLARRGRCRA